MNKPCMKCGKILEIDNPPLNVARIDWYCKRCMKNMKKKLEKEGLLEL